MRRRAGPRLFLRKFVASLLPVAVPLLTLGAATIYVTNGYTSRETVTATTRQLDALKDMIDVTMFELDALNQTFSVNATMVAIVDDLLGATSISVEEVRQLKLLNEVLGAQSNARPYVASVYFYLDRHPDRFLSTSDGVVWADAYPDNGWIASYRSMERGRIMWTETRELRRLGAGSDPQRLFTVYRRLFPTGHGRSGVIVLNIERSHFDGLVSRATLFEDQEVYVLDRDGSLVLANGGRGRLSPLSASARSREVPTLSPERHGGSEYYVYSSPTSRYGWRVVSVIPRASLEGLSVALRTLILAMLGASLLVGAALTLSFVRRHDRRVAAVVALFQKAEQGEATLESPPIAHDEYDYIVETLIRSFLRERYATLQLSERQAKAEVLELKALRAQMNPHFLFNTLESIYWMVFGTDGRPSTAASMIKDLSMLLKYSLEESEEVALSDEIGLAKRYVSIQAYSYPGKFELRWDIEEAALGLRVVKFFLQPLLENAVYHGIRGAEGRREILVRARVDSERRLLLVEVADDGLGMDAARLAEVRASLRDEGRAGDRIGLHNTNRHIRLVFGPAYGLSVESEPGKGARVEVRFPAAPSPKAT